MYRERAIFAIIESGHKLIYCNVVREIVTPEENKKLNNDEKMAGKVSLSSFPVRISMNLTGKCNIRCIYCHLTFSDYYTKDELGLDTFKNLTPFLDHLSHLVYFSSTEPLMARHFDEIFKFSTSFDSEKYISTNGILITKDRAEMFVDGGMEFVTISFGGLTHDSFKQAHQVDALDKVTENIRMLNQIKEERGSEVPRLRIVFVTWKENAHELPEAVRYAHEHRCSEGLKITFLKAYDDNLIESLPYDHQEYVNGYVEETRRLGRDLGVKVEFDGGNFDEVAKDPVNGYHRKCFEPWERLHVEADGKVRTCPVPINTIVAGDLTKQTPEEIWNGPVYKMFRERTNTIDPPDPCKRCTHNFHKDFQRRDIWDQRDMDLGIYERIENKNYLKRGQKGAKRR